MCDKKKIVVDGIIKAVQLGDVPKYNSVARLSTDKDARNILAKNTIGSFVDIFTKEDEEDLDEGK